MILEALASLKTMFKIKWMSHLSDIASDRLNTVESTVPYNNIKDKDKPGVQI